MKESYQEILTKFNIPPTAAKVYLALLDLGKGSADKIAKRAGTYKANVYDALERLMAVGLVTFVIEGAKKTYLPTNPEKLLALAEESEQKALADYEKMKKDITRIMPQLSLKYGQIKEKEIFEIYKGKNGYRAMILDILRENPKYWKGFGNLQVQEYFPYDFPKWFKNIPFKLFSIKSELFLKRLKEARRFTKVEITYLPEELYMPMVWTLFGDNLLILIYEPEIIALRITSSQITKTFSSQFDYLWRKHINEKKAK